MILAIPSSYAGIIRTLASRQDDEVIAITESVFAYPVQLSSRKHHENRDGAITFQDACALGCDICLSDSAPHTGPAGALAQNQESCGAGGDARGG
jgi:hypothetical protein